MNVAKALKALRIRAGLSRDKLATLTGYERGTSLVRYEDEEHMRGRKLPTEIAAKLARALVGKGNPSITEPEIWALAEKGSPVALATLAVTLVPVHPWSLFQSGAFAMTSAIPSPLYSIEVPALNPSEYLAFRVEGHEAARIAPHGSTAILDCADKELRDGKCFAVVFEGRATIRRYRSNPERWESEALSPDPAIFPKSAVDVLGRLVRVITEF